MIYDYLIIFVPIISGISVFLINSSLIRSKIIPLTATIHFVLSLMIIIFPCEQNSLSWIFFDRIGQFFLLLTSILFLICSVYTCYYLREHEKEITYENVKKSPSSEKIFIACLLFFLSTMTIVAGAQNIGLLWIGMEATTLASAPLIYFNRTRYSLEATWKYLLICSVGIGLALFGNIFVEMSFHSTSLEPSLLLSNLINNAHILDTKWMKFAFIFFLVGYGTKMGLAPMHTWLPDAHSEAPAMVSALMSGALLNCGFLGILRVHQILIAAGVGYFSRELLLIFGLVSLFIAAVFILGQKDFKRMLAYSSIENMGIIAVGIGLGGEAVFGSLLQVINHSFIKGALFLLAGNIYIHYKTRKIENVSGMIETMPVTGILWIASFIAISGIPPFGMFISEFIIVKSAISSGYYFSAVIFLFLLTAVFAGMSILFIKTGYGSPPDGIPLQKKESPLSFIPPLILIVLALALGLYIPSWLSNAITMIASLI